MAVKSNVHNTREYMLHNVRYKLHKNYLEKLYSNYKGRPIYYFGNKEDIFEDLLHLDEPLEKKNSNGTIDEGDDVSIRYHCAHLPKLNGYGKDNITDKYETVKKQTNINLTTNMAHRAEYQAHTKSLDNFQHAEYVNSRFNKRHLSVADTKQLQLFQRKFEFQQLFPNKPEFAAKDGFDNHLLFKDTG